MKLTANIRRVAGYKKPIEVGDSFEADPVLGAILISRGEAKLWKATPPAPPKVEVKKETAVSSAAKVETRSK